MLRFAHAGTLRARLLMAEPVIDCTLVTCENVPLLDPDDRVLLEKLRARGFTVSVEVWSDPRVDWSSSRLCLLRSTWDYHSRYLEFSRWLEQAAKVSAIRNDRQLVRWNMHKSYLRRLEERGVPIVPTIWVRRGQRCMLADVLEAHEWRDLVIKPAQGAAAHDVMRVKAEPSSLAAGQTHLERLSQAQDVLVQPYLQTVMIYGERSLIFFRGCYSHAVVKKPFDTTLAVRSSPSALVDATDDEMAVAVKSVQSVPGHPLYARVDLLRDDEENVRVSEVELIEPGLYMSVHEPASSLFADAIEEELSAIAATRLYKPL